MQVGVGRVALVAALGQLLGCCTRALQVQQLRCGSCCQSCMHAYKAILGLATALSAYDVFH